MLNSNNEIWKAVEGYEDQYLISSKGSVYGIVRRKHKSSRTTSTSGYLYIKAYKHNKMQALSIHRMVATAFIPNPEQKLMVNHIDGDKLNNNASNLEWVTCSENHKHAYAIGLRKPAKAWLGKKAGKTSKYRNVTWDPSRNKWKGTMKHNGKMYFQKRFDTEIEAAEHVNWIIDKLGIDRPKNIIT